MVVSRIGPRGRVTVPREVRASLNLAPGDAVRYAIGEDGTVTITKAPAGADETTSGDPGLEAAIDEYLASPGPTRSADEVVERLHARIETKSRERDAA